MTESITCNLDNALIEEAEIFFKEQGCTFKNLGEYVTITFPAGTRREAATHLLQASEPKYIIALPNGVKVVQQIRRGLPDISQLYYQPEGDRDATKQAFPIKERREKYEPL